MGTHDLDTIEGPFTYEALPPESIRFRPLGQVCNPHSFLWCLFIYLYVDLLVNATFAPAVVLMFYSSKGNTQHWNSWHCTKCVCVFVLDEITLTVFTL